MEVNDQKFTNSLRKYIFRATTIHKILETNSSFYVK